MMEHAAAIPHDSTQETATDTASVAEQADIGGPRDIEAWLRDHGVSGRKAKAAASAAWRVIGSEPDDDNAAGELADYLEAAVRRLRRN